MRSYPESKKRAIVSTILIGGLTYREASKTFGVGTNTLCEWAKVYKNDLTPYTEVVSEEERNDLAKKAKGAIFAILEIASKPAYLENQGASGLAVLLEKVAACLSALLAIEQGG